MRRRRIIHDTNTDTDSRAFEHTDTHGIPDSYPGAGGRHRHRSD